MKYSVIIPVYNAEKTLRRCMDSLLAENYTDAEIILVNDGSKDNSEEICREYAEARENVRFISKENGGVSSARNAGLDAACGEYVLFVDSDDHVEPNAFALIDETVDNDSADYIRFASWFDNGAEKRRYNSKSLSVHGREALLPYIVDSICRKTINAPVAKLYKREIIEEHQIRFNVGVSVGEDLAFNIVYSFYIRSFAQSDEAIYIVNTENNESLSRKRHGDLHEQFKKTAAYLDRELAAAPIPDSEKKSYRQAIDYVNCVGIYYAAKLMIIDREGWWKRQKSIFRLSKRINSLHMKYPGTCYCALTTLPVRLYLTPVIDAIARRLSKRA